MVLKLILALLFHFTIASENISNLYEKKEYELVYNELISCGFKESWCVQILGDMYFMGHYVEQDIAHAIALWKVSADLGSADGQFNLGLAYLVYPLMPSLECKFSNFEQEYNFETQTTNTQFADSIPCEIYPYSSSEAPEVLKRYLFILKNEKLKRNNITSSSQLSNLYMYSSSLAGHPGAQLAMGYRHEYGYGTYKSCNAASLNYLEVARNSISIHTDGLPSITELIRLTIPQWESIRFTSIGTNQNREDLAIHLAEKGNPAIQTALAKRYLLGVDGFSQNVEMAYKFLRKVVETAQSKVNVAIDPITASIYGEALSLLGYIYALGLGINRDLNIAAEYFSASAFLYEDPGGHNGMGYIYFHGTDSYGKNPRLAFHHFNESAHHLFADAQFNLASMYLTGIGTTQSYTNALIWYSRALEQGHVPAAYALAQLHLNGIGTIKDCNLAIDFLRIVLNKSPWITNLVEFTNKLLDSKDRSDINMLIFSLMKLSVAGHDSSMANLALLLHNDISRQYYWGTDLWPFTEYIYSKNSTLNDTKVMNTAGISTFIQSNIFKFFMGVSHQNLHSSSWYFPQLFLEFSIDKDNIASIVRYGDYAYFGRGIITIFDEYDSNDQSITRGWIRNITIRVKVNTSPNYKRASYIYRISANTIPRSRWMLSHISEANFNLGYMYQFGIGLKQDFLMASSFYKKMEATRNIGKIGISLKNILIFFIKIHEFTQSYDKTLYFFCKDPSIRRIFLLSVTLALAIIFRFALHKSTIYSST
ncbi:hypothetical protein cand_027410 [Cryptosporidium andersoni]|uniref:Sel1 repeat family protein n=1 Tax=Cryptosporidium andersoni TaxID=117008 RepID=A0A1J4MRA2_9CRYT|nr:hypothetical protein cand_027410 [Cryptosporidium andersoni]